MLEVMMMQAARYATCLNERDIEGAEEAATSIFPLWLSLKSGVTVIDTTTGEVGPMRETFSLDVIDHVNDSLGGIPAAVDVRLALRRESGDQPQTR